MEAFATIALAPLMLAIVVQKTRNANLLTELVNFLKSPSDKTHKVVFYTISAAAYQVTALVMIRSLFDSYSLSASDLLDGFQQNLIWLVVLVVIQNELKLLILGLGLLAALWVWITWQSDSKTVLGHMKDFKLYENLTRKVAS